MGIMGFSRKDVIDALRKKCPGWSHYFVNGPYEDGSVFAGAWEVPGAVQGRVFCEKESSLTKLYKKVSGK